MAIKALSWTIRFNTSYAERALNVANGSVEALG